MFKLIVMFKLFSIFSISSLFQGPEVSRSIFAFMIGIACAFRAVYRRALSTIGTTLMLAAFLSACGGGGGGSSDAPTPAVPTPPTLPTTPTFSISSSNLSVDEDFAPSRIVASVSNATAITVRQSNNGVVNITNSNAQVDVSSILHANGRTVLTIRATNGTFTATTQVTVTVNAVNDPPTLAISSNSISTVSGFSSITINTTATDVEDTNLIFTVMDVNTGVITVTQSTNAIVLNAIAGASGQTTLTVSLVDSSGTTVTQTIAVNVTIAAGAAPVLLVSTNRINVQEDFGTPVVIRTTVTDSDSTTLTLTVTSSMRLIDVEISTRTDNLSTITLTTIANLNGTATLSFRATDDGGQTNSTEIVVVVAAVNDTPTLTVPTATLIVLEDFDVTNSVATFADVDRGDALTVTVTESTTGVVTVTTSASGVSVSSIRNVNGRTTLNISLSDGRLSTTAQVVVDVTVVNDPPTLSVSPTALTLNEDFGTTEVITVSRSDIDSNTLTFTVAESATGVVNVTTTDAGIQVVSIGNVNGQTTLTMTVSDSQASVSTQVVVTVNAVNDTPTLSVSSNSITTVGGFSAITINTTASDIEDANISFTVIDANPGVVTVTTSTNAVVLNTIAGASGQTTLTVRVVDSSGTTVTQFISVSVTITVSAAPVVTVSTNLIRVMEDFGTSVIIQSTATDSDATDTITVSVSASQPIITALISTPVNGQSTITNRIILNAIADANGTATLTVFARDAGGQSHSTEIVVVVRSVEDAPTLTIPTATLIVAEDFTSTQTIATARDGDGDPLLISVAQSTTGIVTVTTSVSGVFVSSILNANGQTTLTITVSDSTLSATTQVVVTVTAVNDPPVLSVSTTALTLIEEFTIPVLIRIAATDLDNDTITLSVSSASLLVDAVLSTLTNGMSTITLSAIANANGTTTLTVQAMDAAGQTVSTNVVVVVLPVNDPPVLTISTTALTLAEDFGMVLIATTKTDIDNTTLTLSVTESATGVVTVLTSTTGISVSSIDHRSGRTTLAITLSDNELISTAQVVLTVTAVNDTPTFSISSATLTVAEDFSSTMTIATVNDVDGDTLTITVAESSTGIVRVTTSASGVQIVSLGDVSGQTTLMITASDSKLSATTQVVVTVTAVNDPPVLSVSTTALTLIEEFTIPVLIIIAATDLDNDTITLSVSSASILVDAVLSTLTNGMSTITLSAIANANGTTTLTVQAMDAAGQSDSTNVVVVVAPVNDPPVLSVSTTALTLVEDFGMVLIATTRTDIDNTTLTLTVAESATGVVTVLTSTTGISVSSIDHRSGRTTLAITLSDNEFISTAQVVLTVTAVNDTPTFSISSATLTVAEDFASTLTIATASDVDGDTITFTVAESSTGIVRVTTSASGVQIVSLGDVSGQTTLMITVSDSTLSATTQVVVTVTAVNDPPVLSVSTTALTLIEDFTVPVLIRIAATDLDKDTITLSVTSSSRLVDVVLSTLTNSMSTITLIAMDNANGTTTLTVQAMDAAGQTVSTNVMVVVLPVNDPPVLTVSTTALTLAEDFATVFLIGTTRTDIDSTTLTLTVAESTTGVVSVTATDTSVRVSNIANANGRTTLTITLSDGRLSTTTQVVVTVTAVNDPPVLTVATNALTLLEDFGADLIGIIRSDIDSNTLTLTVEESTTGVVTVTPSAVGVFLSSIEHKNGRTTLTITLSDNEFISTAQVVVVVTAVNDPTILNIPNARLTRPEEFMGSITVATAINVDGDTLTITVVESSTGVVRVVTLASDVQIESLPNVSGQTTLMITVSDGSTVRSTAQVVVDVTPVNDPPAVSVSTTVLTLNEDFTVPVLIGITATDAENDTITLSVSSSSFLVDAVLSTLTNGMSTLTLTAIANADGTTTLTVEAMDATGLSVSTNVVVFVAGINFPPTLNIPSTTLTILEDFVGAITVATASDVDVDALTFTVVESSTGVVHVTTSASGVRISRLGEANGVTTLSISVSDDSTVSLTTQVVVTVRPVNDPPALTISTTALTLLEDFTTAVIVITKRDVDGDTLTLTVSDTSATFDLVRVTTTASNVQVASILNANGQTTLTIALSDGQTTTSAQVAVSVVAVNDPPTLFVQSTSILALTGSSGYTEIIQIIATDVEDSTLTITVSDSTPGVITVTTSPTAITVNAVRGASGQTILTVRAVDSSGTAATQTISVNVIINSPPSLFVTTTRINVQQDFTGSVFIGALTSDVDGDTITLSVSSTTRLVDVTISTLTNSQSTITLSAIDNVTGITTLVVQAMDGFGQSVSTNVVVVVNDPPVLTITTTSLTLIEDFMGGITVATARDVNNHTLTFTVVESSTGVVIVTTSASAVQIASLSNVSGQTTLMITVSDGITASSTAQVVITVTPVYDPPTLSSSVTLTVVEDFAGDITVATTKYEAVDAALILTVTESATGVVTVTTTADAVSVSNIPNANGQTTLTITLSVGTFSTSVQVAVSVTEVYDTPTLSVSTNSIMTLGGFTPITIHTTATVIDDPNLTFTVTESTPGVVRVTQSTNAIVLNTLAGASGQSTLTVTLTDNTGTVVIRTIAVNVIVVPSNTPVLTVSTNLIRVQEDFASMVIGTTATDADTTGALLVTVSSSTHLVNTVISTHTITLSPVANLFGTTTLTVRAPDAGGVFDSTEIVVVVTPVNDTPTITVSRTVILASASTVLNVSASDVEDGILAFSVSSSQNLVRATVTTTSLTITRLYSQASSITLTLSATDTARVTTSTQIVVTLSPFFTFTVTTGIKTLDFAWSAISTATHYQLRSNPDGNSGFVDLTTTGVVVSPNSTMIRQTTAQARVSLRHYIPRANGPQYAVNICTTTPCGSSFLHGSVALTNAQLNGLIGRLQASNADPNDAFGDSVSISGDGNTLVVGASGEQSLSTGVNVVQNDNSGSNVGAVYIFRRNNGVWSQQAYIKALKSGENDNFGFSVNLSDDGNTLAVGAYGESGGSTGINGAQDLNNAPFSGAAYVFRFNGGVWSQQAYIKAPNLQLSAQFGFSVSLSANGNTLAVGESGNSLGNTGVNDVRSVAAISNSGAAYVFRFSTTSNTWGQQAFIKATNTGSSDFFGSFVSLSADGNTLAVGAVGEDGASTGINGVQSSNGAVISGAVYLFRFRDGVWSQQAYIKPSNTQRSDEFSHSGSLSSNGNTLAVGARFEDGGSTGVNGVQDNGATDSGAVYVFRFIGGEWTQQAYIKASNTGDRDYFGQAVSLSADGNTLAVGATSEDSLASGVGGAENNDSSTDSGAVYVFEFSNSTWTQQAYIKSNPNAVGGSFGISLSFSNDGQTLAVGATIENSSMGAVYLY